MCERQAWSDKEPAALRHPRKIGAPGSNADPSGRVSVGCFTANELWEYKSSLRSPLLSPSRLKTIARIKYQEQNFYHHKTNWYAPLCNTLSTTTTPIFSPWGTLCCHVFTLLVLQGLESSQPFREREKNYQSKERWGAAVSIAF